MGEEEEEMTSTYLLRQSLSCCVKTAVSRSMAWHTDHAPTSEGSPHESAGGDMSQLSSLTTLSSPGGGLLNGDS